MNSTDIQIFSAIAVLVAIGAGGVYAILWLARRNRLGMLLRRTSPTPRARHAGSASACVQLARWQKPAASPARRSAVEASIGPLLVGQDGERAVLRAAGDESCRFILLTFVLFPLIALSLLVLAKGAAGFFLNDVHREYYRLVDGENGLEAQYDLYEPTVTNYFRSLTDGFSVYFGEHSMANFGGFGPAFRAFLFSDSFFAAALAILLLATAFVLLRPAAAPVIFDRKEQIVSTTYRGRQYSAPWRKVDMTLAAFGRNTSPAFALNDPSSRGKTRWFALGLRGSFRDTSANGPATGYAGVEGIDRWQAAHLWLQHFMNGDTRHH